MKKPFVIEEVVRSMNQVGGDQSVMFLRPADGDEHGPKPIIRHPHLSPLPWLGARCGELEVPRALLA